MFTRLRIIVLKIEGSCCPTIW